MPLLLASLLAEPAIGLDSELVLYRSSSNMAFLLNLDLSVLQEELRHPALQPCSEQELRNWKL